MKKSILTVIFAFSILSLYSQTITLTFTAKDSLTQEPLVLGSVSVVNLDESCDTMLYEPVPPLVLDSVWPVGLLEPSGGWSGPSLVVRNVPNPFRETTEARVWQARDGYLHLGLFDLHGRVLSQCEGTYAQGWHQFAITAGGSRLLFLRVSDGRDSRTVRLVSQGDGGEVSRISYVGSMGEGSPLMKTVSGGGGFVFYLGESLMYLAFAEGYFPVVQYDNPVCSASYLFAMLPADTTVTIPEVTTDSVTDITTTTAVSGGDVTSDGGAPVTEKGVCYSPDPGPTIMDFRVIDGTGTGPYVCYLDGLDHSTLYYIRAYAMNAVGTAYGEELTFTTLEATLPVVTTDSATYITQTTATSGGNVTSDGGLPVTARGVCWSLTPVPTTAGDHTTDGSGTGPFESYLSGLIPDTMYYIRAYATNGIGTAYGEELTFTTLEVTLPTVSTAAVTNITSTSATSGGTVTSDGGCYVTARGVCWSLLPNPTTAGDTTVNGSGMGSFVSQMTGLITDTGYYVRAYAINSVGTAYGSELTFATSSEFFCGDVIVKSHVAGNVAPVNKTTSYGTVDGIPGEPSKCWITSNLGSDHQAGAKDDATEASAGWYWQFNRKQGYKHDGVNRIPNTSWITVIDENSNWIPQNDPCTIELGSEWRVPTQTEWTNVDAAGGWIDWDGPWNSDLKMHAAGCLLDTDGTLMVRGQVGHYHSSTQNPQATWETIEFVFAIDISFMNGVPKSFSTTLRCIND